MPNFGLFGSKCLTVMLDILAYKHIFTNQNIYLKCVGGSNSLDPSIIHFWHLLALCTNGKRCSQEGSHPVTSKVKLCVHTMF